MDAIPTLEQPTKSLSGQKIASKSLWMSISGRNFRYVSVLLAGGIAVGMWASDLYGLADFTSDRLVNACGVVAQIAATMMGFLLAALAVLASVANMRLVRNMQRTGHYSVLLARLFISATLFFLLMVVAVSALFFGQTIPFALDALFGLGFSASASLFEAFRNLTAVLLALKPSTKSLE